jgi:hypothetical protein
VKVEFGAGKDGTGIATIVDDADGARLPVGGLAIGNPADAIGANSLVGQLKKIVSLLPTILTVLGNLKVAVQEDNSGVLAGIAARTGSIPVVQPTDDGSTPHTAIAAASVNATVVKASAGTLYGGYIHNRVPAERFFKLYDKATAPTNSDTPTDVLALGAGVTLSIADLVGSRGGKFTAGIAYRTTTGLANNDNTAVAANDLVINLRYL